MKKRKTNKAKRVSPHCRNNNACTACLSNRTHQSAKAKAKAEELAKELEHES